MDELLCDWVRRNIERPQFHHGNKPNAHMEVDTRHVPPFSLDVFQGAQNDTTPLSVSAITSNDALEQKLLGASDD